MNQTSPTIALRSETQPKHNEIARPLFQFFGAKLGGFARTILLFVLFLGGAFVNQTFGAQQDRPNIILILTDDMGFGEPSCYGGDFVQTPNIDRMAKEGTRFTQFYVAAPICSPSRTAFLTGHFPAHWDIHSFLQTRAGNRAVGQADFVDPRAPSLPRELRKNGYATAHIGKWHMGGGRDVTNAPPFSAYGFDEHVSTYESPQPDPDLTGTNWIWSAHDKVRRWDRSRYFVDKTLDFLKRHPNKPCYINLWPDDVHTPWIPEGADLANRRRQGDEADKNFRAVLAEYDKQIGRLLDGLKELGVDKNTIVIFTSDNGPAPDPTGARAGGLRGRKGSLFEGGIRVPFIVRWPARTPAGRVDNESVLNAVDLFPTFCRITKTELPKSIDFAGEDVSKAFQGKTVTRRKSMYWEYGGKTPAFNHPEGRHRSPNLAMREGKWKLLVNDNGKGAELYNIVTDPKETRDLAAENAKRTRQMADSVLKWRKAQP